MTSLSIFPVWGKLQYKKSTLNIAFTIVENIVTYCIDALASSPRRHFYLLIRLYSPIRGVFLQCVRVVREFIHIVNMEEQSTA